MDNQMSPVMVNMIAVLLAECSSNKQVCTFCESEDIARKRSNSAVNAAGLCVRPERSDALPLAKECASDCIIEVATQMMEAIRNEELVGLTPEEFRRKAAEVVIRQSEGNSMKESPGGLLLAQVQPPHDNSATC